MTPFLFELHNSFDKEFEVNKNWSFEGLHEHIRKFYKSSRLSHKNKDCKDCQFVPMCAERVVHSLMKLMNTTNCISPLKSLEDKVMYDKMDLIIKPTELCNFKCTFCSSTQLTNEKKKKG